MRPFPAESPAPTATSSALTAVPIVPLVAGASALLVFVVVLAVGRRLTHRVAGRTLLCIALVALSVAVGSLSYTVAATHS